MEFIAPQPKFIELIDFGRRLALSNDLESLLQSGVPEAGRLAGADYCAVWSLLASPPGLRLRAKYTRSPGEAAPPPPRLWLGRVLREAEPQFLSAGQVRRSLLKAAFPSRRVALLPIAIDQQALGVLIFAEEKVAAFSQAEQQWLRLIAGQFETAARTVAFSDAQSRMREQISEVMSGFAASLSLARDPESFLRLICTIFLRLAQADLSYVWTLKKGKLQRLATSARGPKVPLINEPSALALVRRALHDQVACGWRDSESEAAGSALAFPLKGQRENIGAISLFWQNREAYGETEKNLLLSFAEYIELAIEHLLLQQTEAASQAQLTEFGDSVREIGDSPDNAVRMKKTISAIARTLQCPIAGIGLLAGDGALRLEQYPISGGSGAKIVNCSLALTPGSLAWKALKQQLPLSLAEAGTDPLGKIMGAGGLLCAPLTGREGSLGVIFVAHRTPYAFRDWETALLAAYAGQLALALRNADLADRQTRNLDQLATIAEITRTFAFPSELAPMLEAVLAAACRLLAMKAGIILLQEGDFHKHSLAASHGFLEFPDMPEKLRRLEENNNLSALALRQQKTLTSSDLTRDGRVNYRELSRQGGPRSAIVSPLYTGGEPRGIICAYSWEPREFLESEKRVFTIIADLLVVALENSRHRQEATRTSKAYGELFREVNRQVRNSLQTIVALLEMTSLEPELSAGEAIRRTLQRIQCIHLIHSQLSAATPNLLDMRTSAKQIAALAQSSAPETSQEICIQVSGARILLSPQKATALSLAINELINNALCHGLAAQTPGLVQIQVNFVKSGDSIIVEVNDNGCGLPEDFDLDRQAGMGLKIVCDSVQRQLGGSFKLLRRGAGTAAQMRFPG